MIETKVVTPHVRETGSPSPGAPDRLAASGLVKSFRGRKVVKGVSLDVQAGEVVGLDAVGRDRAVEAAGAQAMSPSWLHSQASSAGSRSSPPLVVSPLMLAFTT